ncbi:MAG: hypothetical protein ChlgKO_08090 [Chlamydiales bacterium]
MSAISNSSREHKNKQIEEASFLRKRALLNARLDRIKTDVKMEEMPKITANRASSEALKKESEKIQGFMLGLGLASTSSSSKRLFPSEA